MLLDHYPENRTSLSVSLCQVFYTHTHLYLFNYIYNIYIFQLQHYFDLLIMLNVAEHLQNKLLPVITHIRTAINNLFSSLST